MPTSNWLIKLLKNMSKIYQILNGISIDDSDCCMTGE